MIGGAREERIMSNRAKLLSGLVVAMIPGIVLGSLPFRSHTWPWATAWVFVVIALAVFVFLVVWGLVWATPRIAKGAWRGTKWMAK